MNKAITDGLVLTPPPFSQGLDVWSRGDGTPGTPTYDGFATAAFVPADQDFGGCLEIVKTETTQSLRYMGETPLLPGCYLQIKARVKAVSGNLPTVRIAAYAGAAGGGPVAGVVTQGPATTLTSYGSVTEITAIVGTGARPGVDLPWGREAMFGHFGIEISGSNGAVIRVDDIEIEDQTSAFLRTMLDWVDVKDFGAVGDNVTDNTAAFEAADAAAAVTGATVLVSSGAYYLADDVTFESAVRFHGTVSMPDDKRLSLRKNFDFETFADAFGDEEIGFRKAFQTLILGSDHDTLDLGGRSIRLSQPVDMLAAISAGDNYARKRVIANGQFTIQAGSAFDTTEVTSDGSYSITNELRLTNVTNVANIEVGSLVIGAGVGREVYVTETNVGAATVTLSQPLYGASSSQTYTFRRFRYALDFSGFEYLTRLSFNNIEFLLDGRASGIMLPKAGLILHFRDCDFFKPKDRAITSIGTACQGMLIDRCQFISNELLLRAQDRTTIAFNINANDTKIRQNRAIRFAHWAVVHGSGHLIQGNHWFQDDNEQNATRMPGLVLTKTNSKMVITSNYIDNNFIEWTNEHDAEPDQANEFSFGSLSITNNIFTVARVGSWFRYIVVKPYGPGHLINGLTVTGNTFKALDSNPDRVEMLDDSIAGLDFSRMRNITWDSNTYHSIGQMTTSPVTLQFIENSPQASWSCDFTAFMPFESTVRNVTGVVIEGPLRNATNGLEYLTPYTQLAGNGGSGTFALNWPVAVSGKVNVTARCDNQF